MSRIGCHIAPDKDAVAQNAVKEPDGERIRAELSDFIKRNKIVSVMLDTDEHVVSIDIVKLPPRIKPVLRLWGSIYVRDVEVIFGQEDENERSEGRLVGLRRPQRIYLIDND